MKDLKKALVAAVTTLIKEEGLPVQRFEALGYAPKPYQHTMKMHFLFQGESYPVNCYPMHNLRDVLDIAPAAMLFVADLKRSMMFHGAIPANPAVKDPMVLKTPQVDNPILTGGDTSENSKVEATAHIGEPVKLEGDAHFEGTFKGNAAGFPIEDKPEPHTNELVEGIMNALPEGVKATRLHYKCKVGESIFQDVTLDLATVVQPKVFHVSTKGLGEELEHIAKAFDNSDTLEQFKEFAAS